MTGAGSTVTWAGCFAFRRRLGALSARSSSSRRALPSRAKATQVRPIASVGHRMSSGWVKKLVKPSLSMPPQLGTDGSPRPRKSIPAEMATEMPAMFAARMMVGARTTVSTWREMIRGSDKPDTRAASTYSSPRTADTAE